MSVQRALRVALVLNPRTLAGARAPLWRRARATLAERAQVVSVLETRGDGGDVGRAGALLGPGGPDVVVAAGGDGTASQVVQALRRAREPRPALAFLPLGTGNNAARSLGLLSLRRDGSRALERALATIVAGERREIDLGLVDGQPFLSSFAIGIDADVLALRNRLRSRLGPGADGYALYLASFALHLPRRCRGARMRLWLDGAEEARELCNLAVLNTPIYAGVFRFDGGDGCADGRLDVHGVWRAREYVSEFPRAWVRHLRVLRRRKVSGSSRLRRARELRVELERPVPAHLDGEQLAPKASFRVVVLPRALRVCTPRLDPSTRP